jgi:hypothetical protein
MQTRLTFEMRAREDLSGGASCAVRASFTEVQHRVQKLIDPTRMQGPEETLRLLINPHRRLGDGQETYDFSLEGDLATLEGIAKTITKAAREFRAVLKKKAQGA